MVKAFIFDCFGVLITDALEALLNEIAAGDAPLRRRVVDVVTAASRGMIEPAESRSQVVALLGMSADDYVSRIRAGEARNQPLLDYIRTLRPAVKTGLLSNVSRRGLDMRFTSAELADYFDVVVASGDIGYAKPEPQAYEVIADRLGVRLEACVMIDDREDYCAGARAVGMQAVQYESFEQCRQALASYLNR